MSWDGMFPGEGIATARRACMQAGCTASGAIRCDYTDGAGHRCPTWWCADHGIPLGRGLHCRRHATVARLLAGASFPPSPPDVRSRAAPLVAWMQRRLDGDVRRLLQRIAERSDATVIVDPLQVLVRPGRGRSWSAAWKVADHRGVITSLLVEVDERRDDEVLAVVDSRPVGHGVPPWIERRRLGTVLSREEDESERRTFIGAIARSLELVATRRETATGWD